MGSAFPKEAYAARSDGATLWLRVPDQEIKKSDYKAYTCGGLSTPLCYTTLSFFI